MLINIVLCCKCIYVFFDKNQKKRAKHEMGSRIHEMTCRLHEIKRYVEDYRSFSTRNSDVRGRLQEFFFQLADGAPGDVYRITGGGGKQLEGGIGDFSDIFAVDNDAFTRPQESFGR